MSNMIEQIHSMEQEEQNKFFEDVLGGLTVGRVLSLVKHLENAWDVEATPNFGQMAPPPKEEEVEEKTDFKVVITDCGSTRIKVVRAVRHAAELSLKETSDLLKNLPATVCEGKSKTDAEALAKEFTELGATVEIQ
jgi:large subunit ribosomal protein L7/L12